MLECRESVLRRYFEGRDVSRLTSRERLTSYSVCLDRKHGQYTDDRGYFVFHDSAVQRNIYVSTGEVGQSQPFHDEMRIEWLFNVIMKNTDHSRSTNMCPSVRKWWIANMKHVVLQLIDTPGNVVLFCVNGRTRSPMYLVAYVAVVYSMLPINAMALVKVLLKDQRADLLDRFDTLIDIVNEVYNNL